MADEGCPAPERGESPTCVAAGLPEVVDVGRKVSLLAETVDQIGRAGQEDIGVDPGIADDNYFSSEHFSYGREVHAVQFRAVQTRCQWTKQRINVPFVRLSCAHLVVLLLG